MSALPRAIDLANSQVERLGLYLPLHLVDDGVDLLLAGGINVDAVEVLCLRVRYREQSVDVSTVCTVVTVVRVDYASYSLPLQI